MNITAISDLTRMGNSIENSGSKVITLISDEAIFYYGIIVIRYTILSKQ